MHLYPGEKKEISKKIEEITRLYRLSKSEIPIVGCVKYSLADNMRQGKKNSHCAVKK